METESLGLELKSICENFIEFMENLKEKNIISKEEFETHTLKKIEFLNEILK